MSRNRLNKKAKIIQFGDEYPDLFVFSPFRSEDNWTNDEPSRLFTFPQGDGGYDFNDAQNPLDIKVMTKRFVLGSNCVMHDYLSNSNFCGLDIDCRNESGYLRLMKDYMYRTLRGTKASGGKKRLYVMMEDGTIRYTWARAVAIPYENFSDTDEKWIPFVVDFEVADSYLYSINDGVTFSVSEYDSGRLVCGLKELTVLPDLTIEPNTSICNPKSCEDPPMIVRDESLLGYVGDVCGVAECSIDPCFEAQFGLWYQANGSIDVEVLVRGSAGSTRPQFGFWGAFNAPSATNDENSHFFQYNNSIAADEYLIIDLNSANTGEAADMTIDTNIGGFDVADININNNGLFELVYGYNTLAVTGGLGAASIFATKQVDKYHN